jgi:hypothetical protein
MEKAGALIERLLELYRKNAGKEQLRITAQLLLHELEDNKEVEQNIREMVSVILPTYLHLNMSNEPEEPAVIPEIKQEEKQVETKPDIIPEPEIKKHGYHFFDPMIDIPTLALKQQEVNETIAAQELSLNDKLKSKSTYKEIGHSIKDGPIKDLKKAIGINDQYLFINELFRGDQTMYERSIKTINSFNIYGEAELWIKRELKLKLGWNESSDVVQLFDQLVKRRFP